LVESGHGSGRSVQRSAAEAQSFRRHDRPRRSILTPRVLYIRRWAAAAEAAAVAAWNALPSIAKTTVQASRSFRLSAPSKARALPPPIPCCSARVVGPAPNSLSVRGVSHAHTYCDLHRQTSSHRAAYDSIEQRRACITLTKTQDETNQRGAPIKHSWLRRLSQQVPRSHSGVCNRRRHNAAASVHHQALAAGPLQALHHQRRPVEPHEHSHQPPDQPQTQHGAGKARADVEGECAEGAARPICVPRGRELELTRCRAGTSLQRTAAAPRTR
jgi:hypothetical protein